MQEIGPNAAGLKVLKIIREVENNYCSQIARASELRLEVVDLGPAWYQGKSGVSTAGGPTELETGKSWSSMVSAICKCLAGDFSLTNEPVTEVLLGRCQEKEYLYAYENRLKAFRKEARVKKKFTSNKLFHTAIRLNHGKIESSHANFACSHINSAPLKATRSLAWPGKSNVVGKRKGIKPFNLEQRTSQQRKIFLSKKINYQGKTTARIGTITESVLTNLKCFNPRMKPGTSDKKTKTPTKPRGMNTPGKDATEIAGLNTMDLESSHGRSGKGRTPPSGEKTIPKRGRMEEPFAEDYLLSSDVEENERSIARLHAQWEKNCDEMLQEARHQEADENVTAELEQSARNISIVDNGERDNAFALMSEIDAVMASPGASRQPGKRATTERQPNLDERIEVMQRTVWASAQNSSNEERATALPPMQYSTGAIRRPGRSSEPGQQNEEAAVEQPVTRELDAMSMLRDLPPASPINVLMAIKPYNYPDEIITEQNLKAIEARLNRAIERHNDSAASRFAIDVGGISPKQGIVAVTCKNAGSVNWLTMTVEAMHANLMCIIASEAELRPAFMCWVCEPNVEFETLRATLTKQGFPTQQWILLKAYAPDNKSRTPGRSFLFLADDALKERTNMRTIKVQYKMYRTQATIRYLRGIEDTRAQGNTNEGKITNKRHTCNILREALFQFKEHNRPEPSTSRRSWKRLEPWRLSDASRHISRDSTTSRRSRKQQAQHAKSNSDSELELCDKSNPEIELFDKSNPGLEMRCKFDLGNTRICNTKLEVSPGIMEENVTLREKRNKNELEGKIMTHKKFTRKNQEEGAESETLQCRLSFRLSYHGHKGVKYWINAFNSRWGEKFSIKNG